MKITREGLETRSKIGAGLMEETPDWYMVRVFGRIPMYVMKDDQSVTPCLKQDGYWEPWITTWFINELTEGQSFIDIGANTGYFSLLAVDQGAKVTAYEPNPRYVEMLRESIKIGWDQTRGDWLPPRHFNVYELAVASEIGTAVLHVPKHLQGSATITNADLSGYEPYDIKCNTVNLDHHTAGVSYDGLLIKVDAEGAEEMIWKGAQVTNYRHKPVWMIEYTPEAYTTKFLSSLERYGDIHWINYDGVEEAISKPELLSREDWTMLVIRPR